MIDMDPELRRRLDLIIGLLSFLSIAALAVVLAVGGGRLLGNVVVFGLVAALLLSQVGLSPSEGSEPRQ